MAHLKATTFDDISKLLTSKNDYYVRLGHNTWAMSAGLGDDDPTILVKLHHTIIARMTPDEITLHTGGYQTVTTKDRLNKLVRPYGYVISQHNWTWFVHEVPWDDGHTARVFEEGMTLKRRPAAVEDLHLAAPGWV